MAAKRAPKKQRKTLLPLWLGVGVFLLAAGIVTGLLLLRNRPYRGPALDETTVGTARISGFSDRDLPLGELEGLLLCRAGIYNGTWVEQGKDTAQKTLAVIVCNRTGSLISQAKFTAWGGTFVVTWLPSGACCLVQEQLGNSDFTKEAPQLQSLILDPGGQDLHPELVGITGSRGEVILANVSGEDVPGSVELWYRTFSQGLYLGGVSYKASVDNGAFRADAVATIQAPHYDPETSVLVTVVLTDQ